MTQAQSKSYGGVKKKLMGAVCMLLVASIMMVSSTYAWFTLSTAPEITGISTSVGANGNLEMALLNTQTFANTDQIKSAVGDSMDNKAENWTVQQANLTWGNLVDLSEGYGLETIKLMPAAANYVKNVEPSKLDTSSLLATAVYGADGRVNTKDGSTLSAVYSDGGFAYSAPQSYGVRAVGVASNVTAREAAFNSAKNSYRISVANTQSAISANVEAFMPIMTGLVADSGSIDYTMTKAQITGMIAIANGMLKDFYGMDIAMKNAILAQAAQNKTGVDGDQFKAIQTALASVTTATDLDAKLKLAETFISGSTPDGVDAYVADAMAAEKTLTDTIAALNGVLETINDEATKTDVQTHVEALLGAGLRHETFKTPTPIKVYMTGGVLGKLAEYNGTFPLVNVASFGEAYAGYGQKVAGPDEGVADSWQNTEAKLAKVTSAVNGMTYEADATGDKTITDTYGYVLDMAFRTNAATSYLKLQTAEAQRVYSDSDSEATRGGGSNMTFTYGNDVTVAQAEKLMKAVRVVFFDPASGTVYATAKLDAVDTSTTGTAKADLKLDATGGTTDKIVDMNQNTATKVSVLVYLDGESIDNSAVSNGEQTGTAMKLNLQFSSSATLTPMENSALRNMQKTTP